MIEDDARVYLHGQRSRRRAPRDRVHISATEADVAGSYEAAEVFGRELKRRQRCFLTDLCGGDLIYSDASLNVRAVGAFGMNPIEEDRRGSRMIAAVIAGASRGRHSMRQIRNYYDLIAKRLQGRQGA